MPIVTRYYIFNRRDLPAKSDELRVRFVPQLVNRQNTLLVLYPNSEPGFEPLYVRYVVRITLALGDGTVAKGLAQIVVTGQRLLGMITEGSAGKTILKESAGSVYAFALDLDDLEPVEIQKNWLGKPVSVRIMSKEGQGPPLAMYAVRVHDVFALVEDDGQAVRTSLPAFLERLTSEGRRNLQKEI
jgi:hypothetical protein